MSVTEMNFAEIAKRHGVDLADVRPLSKVERLARLETTLVRTDVPFPIEPERAEAYLEDFKSGKNFGIGSPL